MTRVPSFLARALPALLVPVAIVAAVPPAAAQPDPPTNRAAPASAPAEVPAPGDGFAHLHGDLAGVRVEGAAASAAQIAFDQTAASLSAATLTRTQAEAALVTLNQRDVELTGTIATQVLARKAAALRLVTARRLVRDLAVSEYVRGTNLDTMERSLDLQESTALGASQLLSDVVREERQAEETAARRDAAAASRAINEAADERLDVRRQIGEQTAIRDQAAADEVRLTTELGVRLFEVDQARSVARVTGADFTLVALDAYWKAAASQGSCGISWWAVAGISRVEGRHGTYGGVRLGPDGQVSRPIIGIQLNGSRNTAVIGDTDGGALDSDTAYDRAVGPMQFIPSTWSRWARDGDGDGDRDPQNMYDATAAAAAYLCNGGAMRTDADLQRGYFSYNHSEAYVAAVLSYARSYSRLRIPDPPPLPPVSPAYPA